MQKRIGWIIIAAIVATGCGNANGDDNLGPGATVSTGSGTPGAGWQLLVSGDWQLPKGTEDYACVYATAQEDVYINSFRPISPFGTHHTVLTAQPTPIQPDGIYACDANTNGPEMLYGSGVDTADYSLPQGVAVKVSAGHQLILNLHLLNASTNPLTGTSGVEVKTLDATDVDFEAEALLAGKTDGLTVGFGETTQSGTCTMGSDVTVGAVFPHMHQLGVHLKATAQPMGVSLRDAPYEFDSQQWYPIEPLALSKGDQLNVDCTYVNNTTDVVGFGDSSYAEMCFLGAMIWPKDPNRDGYTCTQ